MRKLACAYRWIVLYLISVGCCSFSSLETLSLDLVDLVVLVDPILLAIVFAEDLLLRAWVPCCTSCPEGHHAFAVELQLLLGTG